MNWLMNWPGLTPCWPSAGPIGGAGVALPPGAWSLNCEVISFLAMVQPPGQSGAGRSRIVHRRSGARSSESSSIAHTAAAAKRVFDASPADRLSRFSSDGRLLAFDAYRLVAARAGGFGGVLVFRPIQRIDVQRGGGCVDAQAGRGGRVKRVGLVCRAAQRARDFAGEGHGERLGRAGLRWGGRSGAGRPAGVG